MTAEPSIRVAIAPSVAQHGEIAEDGSVVFVVTKQAILGIRALLSQAGNAIDRIEEHKQQEQEV